VWYRGAIFRVLPAADACNAAREGEGGESVRGQRTGKRAGRAKGKDLNGLSQKAFSYSPWQTTMAKWQERENIF